MLNLLMSAFFGPIWVVRQQAGGSPAATHFLLLRQKKVSKEKATPLPASPFADAAGATCGARSSRGRARTRFAQTIARPDPSGPPLLGAVRRGGGKIGSGSAIGLRQDALCASCLPALVLVFGIRSPHPSGWAEERRQKRIRARDCLRRSRVRARPRFCRAPQVARSEAKGPRPSGRLFFAFFLLATQKKEGRPPGRDPACWQNTSIPITQTISGGASTC
jgi:hypothetical protein